MRGLFGKLKTKRENRMLCKQFPFLIPWNRFTGKYIAAYDYSFTELDSLPEGWRKAFGVRMCEEIKAELLRVDDLERWRIVQMKEKYGELRIYDNGHKQSSRIDGIIEKYMELSKHTCIVCGKPATRKTLGWIAPYCDECCPDMNYVRIGEDDDFDQ